MVCPEARYKNCGALKHSAMFLLFSLSELLKTALLAVCFPIHKVFMEQNPPIAPTKGFLVVEDKELRVCILARNGEECAVSRCKVRNFFRYRQNGGVGDGLRPVRAVI